MFIIEIHGYSPKPPHGQSSPLALLSFSFLEKGKPGSHYYLTAMSCTVLHGRD